MCGSTTCTTAPSTPSRSGRCTGAGRAHRATPSSLTATTGKPKPVLETIYPEGTGIAEADGDTKINLAWSAVAKIGSDAINGYRIDESTDCSTWTERATVSQGAGDTSVPTTYQRTGLSRGDIRCYRVRAQTASTNGVYSVPVRGNTRPRAPGTPSPTVTPEPDADNPTHHIVSWAPVEGHGYEVNYIIDGWSVEKKIRPDGKFFARLPVSDTPRARMQAYIDDSKMFQGKLETRYIHGDVSGAAQVADGTTGAPERFDPFSGTLRRTPTRHDGTKHVRVPAPLQPGAGRSELPHRAGPPARSRRRPGDQRASRQPARKPDLEHRGCTHAERRGHDHAARARLRRGQCDLRRRSAAGPRRRASRSKDRTRRKTRNVRYSPAPSRKSRQSTTGPGSSACASS